MKQLLVALAVLAVFIYFIGRYTDAQLSHQVLLFGLGIAIVYFCRKFPPGIFVGIAVMFAGFFYPVLAPFFG